MPHRASAARILVHGQHPPQHSASDGVTLALDGLHDLRDIFLAGVVVGSLHHHADKGLGAGLTNQNTSGIAQRFSHSLDGSCTAGSFCAAFLSVTRTFSRTCG